MARVLIDRKSTRLNSSHLVISYAVFCLKKKRLGKSEDEKCCFAFHWRIEMEKRTKPEMPTSFGVFSPTGHVFIFFLNDTATTEIYPLPLHDALPICERTTQPAVARLLLTAVAERMGRQLVGNIDRKSVVYGKSVDLGGRRIIKK